MASQSTVDTTNVAYRCCTCGQSFGANDVYDQNGRVICKPCFDRSVASTLTSAKAPLPRYKHGFVSSVICPHCWHRCAPEDLLWVAQHTELMGDQILGPEAPVRFLPSRFTMDGQALDARGMPCQLLACPHCHLIVSRSLLTAEPLFISIIGVPASGKSYFLTAMTWELRKLLPGRFAVAFNDADTITNRSLNEYEETLFLHGAPDELVAIRKTELQGELYDQVKLGQHILSLPRPFLFSLQPIGQHPHAPDAAKYSQVVCVYDNAGEHFQPGMDSATSPVTQHLARSRALMFLYDPTQDPRLRDRCRAFSNDPQLSATGRTQRQETILVEAAMRIRRYAGLAPGQKHDRPMIVVVPKADGWASLIDLDLGTEPFVNGRAGDTTLGAVSLDRVETVSARVRQMLMEYAPEFVAAAEDFCQHIVYVPVSALGRPPEAHPQTGMLGIRPRDIRPQWVTVPMLYMLAKWSRGLVGSARIAATSPTGKRSG